MIVGHKKGVTSAERARGWRGKIVGEESLLFLVLFFVLLFFFSRRVADDKYQRIKAGVNVNLSEILRGLKNG